MLVRLEALNEGNTSHDYISLEKDFTYTPAANEVFSSVLRLVMGVGLVFFV